jgi:succinyl-CoA synthetase beta subunit|tara:strand:- start:895 stop:2079 length:1185 start_codon:yes stop_codon:yes gene_type:complete
MNLHEHQAKDLLRKYNLPILDGKSYIMNVEDLDKDLRNIKGPPWVIKSQIHAGGRGAGIFLNPFNDKGGVQITNTVEDAKKIAKGMMGNTLITKQTGSEGKLVNRVYIEAGCAIDREYYLSILLDRNKSKLMLMVSDAGGVDIEDVAEKTPERIQYVHFDNLENFIISKNLQDKLNFSNNEFNQFREITSNLCKAYVEMDASLIEINPLVVTKDEQLILLDAKINIDDNALFRQPQIEKLKDTSEENELELEASENDMVYIKLDGKIGCMVNGAGLAMATMDIIKQFGMEPANFLDLGGTANKERAIKAFKIIQSDKNVKSVFINIFGGIIHCDMIASGIIDAITELDFKLPVVIRFQGTNSKKGRDIINNSSLGLFSIDDFSNAAQKAVELAE